MSVAPVGRVARPVRIAEHVGKLLNTAQVTGEAIAALWALAVAFGIVLYLIPGVIALAAYRWTHAGDPVA